MNRILIIERESSSIALLKRMIEALNFRPTVNLAWSSSINLIPLNEVRAVFLNVEMPRLDINAVVNYFNIYTGPNNFKIPVYFLISQKDADIHEKIKFFKHAGVLSKPFKLEEIYYLLEKNLKLSNITFDQFDLHYNLNKFKEYSNELESWLSSLNTLMNKEQR